MKITTTALFVMPRSSRAWKGSEALWITAAGWAKAAERRLGRSYVITTDRVASPDEVIHYPLESAPGGEGGTGLSRYLPEVLVTGLKDLRLHRTSQNFNNRELDGPWKKEKVKFIWEQHDLFNGQGKKLATRLGVPLISYVHAPTVWEAQKWGVNRPIWGRWLEQSERRSLEQSDLVACVSEQVREKLISMGIAEDRILVSPMSVDAARFNVEKHSTRLLREQLGLEGKTVIGWTGSFRGFHGLDTVLYAFKKALEQKEDLALLLVGDGKSKEGIATLSRQLDIGDKVIFAGKQPFEKIPMFVSSFDVAVVSAANSQSFHYSPLKLREYLAAGIPTIAPDAGEVPVIFTPGKHLVTYRPEYEQELSTNMLTLSTDRELAQTLGKNGKEFILKHGTWEAELEKCLNFLEKSGKY